VLWAVPDRGVPWTAAATGRASLTALSAPIDVERLRREILAWMAPPGGVSSGRVAGRQIRRLVEALERPVDREDRFLSSIAEAVLARRLLEAGAQLEFESPTADGRHADFRVMVDGLEWFVHVKRVALPPGTEEPDVLHPELMELAAIPRPVTVAVRSAPLASADDRQDLARALDGFIREASVGDEVLVRADDGRWLGAARLVGSAPGTHAAVRAGADAGWEAAIPRVQRLLRKAYQQFMPGAANAICLVSDGSAALDAIEQALLGTPVERWDRFPPRGERVAIGRADDGFWSRGRAAGSRVVAWLAVDGSAPARVWEREPVAEASKRERACAAALRRALA
jgi:hypothetical protein